MKRVFPLAVVLATLLPARSIAQDLPAGLSLATQSCQVHGHTLDLKELRLEMGKGLELRALDNPGAHPNPQCRDGYGGVGIESVLSEGTSGLEIWGATNGTVFREVTGSPSRYASNSLLWSKGAGLIAPWRKGGGSSIFVADSHGGHRFEIDPRRTHDLPALLKSRYPGMTLAVQSNMPLSDGKISAQGQFTHWSLCPDPNSSDWRCRDLARTLICAKADGSVSLITSPKALPFDLADGLRPGGACHLECTLLYNLDGGRSTQMAVAKSPGHFELSGGRIETSQKDCQPYRPVANYLVIGRPVN